MTTTPLLSTTAQLRDYALSLPVAAYVQPREISSLDFMRAIFGDGVTEEPQVYCERLGARRNGFTIGLTLPESAGGGAAVFVYNQMNHPEWDTLGEVGQRIGVIHNVITSENCWAAETFTKLASTLIDEVIEGNDPFATSTGTTSLNWADPVWALAHVLHLLSPEEAEEVATAMAARHSNEDVAMVNERTRAADVLKSNLAHADDVLPFLSTAIAEYIEERVASNVITDKPLSQGLLQTPREDWDTEVHRLVAAALSLSETPRQTDRPT